ncbi:MAG: IS3 family transposase [Bacteroidales bacterium]|nr:IS3 family transposase [Bacteroidales bacterium]
MRLEDGKHQGGGLRIHDGRAEGGVRYRPVKKSRGRTVEALKERHPEVSLSSLCELFGYTRQGYWKQRQEHYREEIDTTALLNEVRVVRADMPRCGVRKLQVILAEHGHRIGRDRLFEILRSEGMLVVRRHTRAVTTYSRHWMKKYANLIKGMEITHPNQVWVSDITYVEIYENGVRSFAYLSLITDAYTHEIVGWALHDTLDTEGPLRALKMAIADYGVYGLAGLIHHSDRGCQYCSQDYVNVLKQYGIGISMTDKGDPYENAIAERVNGIIKTEWLYQMRLTSLEKARKVIGDIVVIYNEKRPHMSVGMLTPLQARSQSHAMKKCWKNYWAIRQAVGGSEESASNGSPQMPPDTASRRAWRCEAAVPQ